MDDTWAVASLWMALALAASLVSIRSGLSVALAEILFGVLGGNLGLDTNETDLGKLILAACFVNDLGTVLALGVLFANFNIWMAAFVAFTVPTLWVLPKVASWVIARWGGRTSEPEVKFFLLVLFVLGWLAASARSEAVLPAYLVGLVAAGVLVQERLLLQRMRAIA